mmetsp:Transcript_139076/g.252897  ORF Transcript_139076/g.252897 Transcript_139076/m.252897 type:complete len:124 (-) Transcript_139076:31-402(-)
MVGSGQLLLLLFGIALLRLKPIVILADDADKVDRARQHKDNCEHLLHAKLRSTFLSSPRKDNVIDRVCDQQDRGHNPKYECKMRPILNRLPRTRDKALNGAGQTAKYSEREAAASHLLERTTG